MPVSTLKMLMSCCDAACGHRSFVRVTGHVAGATEGDFNRDEACQDRQSKEMCSNYRFGNCTTSLLANQLCAKTCKLCEVAVPNFKTDTAAECAARCGMKSPPGKYFWLPKKKVFCVSFEWSPTTRRCKLNGKT